MEEPNNSNATRGIKRPKSTYSDSDREKRQGSNYSDEESLSKKRRSGSNSRSYTPRSKESSYSSFHSRSLSNSPDKSRYRHRRSQRSRSWSKVSSPSDKRNRSPDSYSSKNSKEKKSAKDPRDKSKRETWKNKVYILGEIMKENLFHFCDTCLMPIYIYCRLIPCKHVFCYACGSKYQDKKCPRCDKKVNMLEKCTQGNIFMCYQGGSAHSTQGCRRTYLSQRDLESHINHRHNKNSTSCVTNPIKSAPVATIGVPMNPIPNNMMQTSISSNQLSVASIPSVVSVSGNLPQQQHHLLAAAAAAASNNPLSGLLSSNFMNTGFSNQFSPHQFQTMLQSQPPNPNSGPPHSQSNPMMQHNFSMNTANNPNNQIMQSMTSLINNMNNRTHQQLNSNPNFPMGLPLNLMQCNLNQNSHLMNQTGQGMPNNSGPSGSTNTMFNSPPSGPGPSNLMMSTVPQSVGQNSSGMNLHGSGGTNNNPLLTLTSLIQSFSQNPPALNWSNNPAANQSFHPGASNNK